jgi:alpha-D-ribose 1-methylphosphonate 5-triphosphate synthase subunit PhnG
MKESDKMSMPENADARSARAAWMRVLALSQTRELEAAIQTLGDLPAYDWLRKPETGMTMVQGRTGGTGARFNLGEMTITRCALTLRAAVAATAATSVTPAAARVGMAYVQGRSAKHAEYAAIADALLQSPEWHERIERIVLAPLQRARRERLAQRAAAVAQTRVDFFTMDRGENPNA